MFKRRCMVAFLLMGITLLNVVSADAAALKPKRKSPYIKSKSAYFQKGSPYFPNTQKSIWTRAAEWINPFDGK